MSNNATHSNPANRPLKVLSLPHYVGSNPYTDRLRSALEQQGVEFLPWKEGSRLSHVRSLLAHRKAPDILHQQWMHVDTLRPTLARSILATTLCFLQLILLRLLGV